MLDCGFAKISTWAYPCFSKLSVSFKLGAGEGGGSEGRLVSSWVSACCTDIGLSAGMHSE